MWKQKSELANVHQQSPRCNHCRKSTSCWTRCTVAGPSHDKTAPRQGSPALPTPREHSVHGDNQGISSMHVSMGWGSNYFKILVKGIILHEVLYWNQVRKTNIKKNFVDKSISQHLNLYRVHKQRTS